MEPNKVPCVVEREDGELEIVEQGKPWPVKMSPDDRRADNLAP